MEQNDAQNNIENKNESLSTLAMSLILFIFGLGVVIKESDAEHVDCDNGLVYCYCIFRVIHMGIVFFLTRHYLPFLVRKDILWNRPLFPSSYIFYRIFAVL